jgi:mannose-6-phosphate isomerase
MSENLLSRLLAGLAASIEPGGRSPLVSHLADAKMVRKQWGAEWWLVPETAPFGFKFIHIRAGQRTSLQYHQQKEEANFVVEGEATLYHADAPGEPLVTRRIVPGDIVHVRAGTVHRIEAITALSLLEVSTRELDDVVRLEDDWGRGDGRIASEHS